jgi:hypothetical protein
MNTIEKFKDLATKFQANKTIESALRLGDAMLTLRERAVEASSGDLAEADVTETKFLDWFKISDATTRRLKLLAIWKGEVLAESPKSLTDAYRITERLNKAALKMDNSKVNRGGRPRKSDVEWSHEYLSLAAEHWQLSGRPSREFVDRARLAVEG